MAQLKNVDDLKKDAWNIYKQVSRRVKQYTLNLTPLETKVEEATNNDPWGPHGSAMQEITREAHSFDSYKQIMGVLARRLQDEGENWRHVYKTLLLLEYMCKHGPQKVVDEVNSNITLIDKLQRFEYKDKNLKDWGLNVRQRAKALVTLVSDADKIRKERQKARENESKYTGVSSDEVRFGKGSGFGSASSDFKSSGASGFGGGKSAMSGFGSTDAYDDFDDRLKISDRDDDEAAEERAAKEATRKRIEAMKKAPESPEAGDRGKGASLRVGKAAETALAAEARGPKRLSQVKVDPNIAAKLGSISPSPPPKPAPVPATAPPPVIDLFGGAPAPAAKAPTAAAPAASWDAFKAPAPVDDDPFGELAARPQASGGFEPFAAAPAVAAPPASDPFGELTGPGPASMQPATLDPFEQLAASNGASARPAAAADPFSAPETAADPFAGPQTRGGAAADPFALPGSPARPAAGVSPSSRIGHALPEDMFTSGGSPTSLGEFGAFDRAKSSTAAAPQAAFGVFSSPGSAGQDPFAASEEAVGGGAKMAPHLQQPRMPPPINKRDPFEALWKS